MVGLLNLGEKFDSFVVDQQAGVTGKSVMAQFPCILDDTRFYVWLGATSVSNFGNTTFMNLANLAEERGA